MTTVHYCTPEWLDRSAEIYNATPELKERLRRFSARLYFRIRAEPEWGIDEDIIFAEIIEEGDLSRLAFVPEEEARRDAEFLLSASPPHWKSLLRRESKFVTDFMLGKVTLEQGNRVKVLSLAPNSDALIDLLTQVEIQYPDEMSKGELAAYRQEVQAFRAELAV